MLFIERVGQKWIGSDRQDQEKSVDILPGRIWKTCLIGLMVDVVMEVLWFVFSTLSFWPRLW